MHHILERQIKKVFKGGVPSSPEQEEFLKVVSDTYDDFDQDRVLLGRSFDISSREFAEINARVSKLIEDLKIEKEGVERKVVERTQELKQKVGELDTSNQLLTKRERELIFANERLHDLDKVKSEFIKIAAHQLRTPLTPIVWTLKELKNAAKTEEEKRLIENILRRASDLVALVNSMLSVSRIEAGGFLPNKRPADIKEVISYVFKSFESMAHQKNIIYTIQLPEKKMPPVQLDQELIQMAVSNLIQNAINYTPEGGSVTVSVEKKNSTVFIRVRDTGIGITPEERVSLFGKLYRSKRSIRLQPDGMGLGLYVAQQVVAAQGGELVLEKSGEGRGSMFRIALPQKGRE